MNFFNLTYKDMKNLLKKCLPILLIFLSVGIAAQSSPTFQTITQNGIFDHVFDRFGNECPLNNLSLTAARPGSNSSYSASAIPTNTCSAGYFDLYFAAGSYFDLTPAAAAVICQVFTDISSLISSPLSVGSNTVNRINIYCANNGASAPAGALAAASGFYLMPLNPINPNAGIVDNQIQKALISGQNPFANLPIGVFPGSSNFYSGYIYINPTPPSPWHLNTAVATINATDFDLYSIMLHEVTHALGFHSFLYIVNQSLAGAGNNYFTRYDQYLTNSAGTPLLAGPSPACSNSSLTLQGPTSAISPSYCVGGGTDASTCSIAARYISPNVNVAVYTPLCYEIGSSMSHFEDMCSVPASFSSVATCSVSPPGIYNNLYYVMSNANGTGNCYVKRQLKPEERYVLCDLGYSVNTTYTSSAASPTISSGYTVTTGVAGSTVNYGGSACQGSNIWGMHDGFAGNLFTYTTSTSVFTVLTSSLLSNDATSAASVTCVEVIFNNAATVSMSGGTLTVNSPAPGGIGLVVLKYIPKNSAGQPGNPTYIYVYFVPIGGCSPSSCNMVPNPGFEILSSSSPLPCGEIWSTNTDVVLSCWVTNTISPDYFKRGCGAYPYRNLGTDVFFTNLDSWYGWPNDAIVGTSGSESIKTNLNSPLIPGQSYQFSIWLYALQSNTFIGSTNAPLVISVATDVSILSITGGSYPYNLPVIATHTVQTGVWTQFTNTFVFAPGTSTVPHNVLFLGIDAARTNSLSGFGAPYYAFYDDLSLTPLTSVAAAFSIPQAANCGSSKSFTNLGQYANYPGTFSGPGVVPAASGTTTIYNFNSPPSLPSGTYAIAFTYTDNSGCANTISQNVILGTANFTLNANSTLVYCSNLPPPQPPVTLSASATSSAGVSFVWQPGSLSGPVATVIPVGNSVFTVNALGNCLLTETVSVALSNSCCTSTITPLTGSMLNTSNISGPLVVNSDITVPNGQVLSFLGGEYLFAPNVKIIVNSGGVVAVKNSHMYACSSTMWAGIELKDGSAVVFAEENYDNLIEDAIIAVDITNHTLSTVSTILEAKATTFNKNYIDININNYQRNSSNYPFKIEKCVFTCRNFTFSPNTWPQTSVNSPDLRYAVPGATLDLPSPYSLINVGVTNLKNPYSSQPSKTAIQLTNVGLTGSGTYSGIAIGSAATATLFNLFDAHGYFIDAENSNVVSMNNVFQNTQSYYISGGVMGGYLGGMLGYYEGGTAIYHRTTNLMNTRLDLTATNPSLGNRFWNCHRGVSCTKTFRFNMENAVFRSTQSNTLLPNAINGEQPGTYGVIMSTNKVSSYMRYNEFTNINTGVKVNIVSTSYTLGSPSVQNGVYANILSITNNTFSPLGPNATSTVIGTNYINKAVHINSGNSFSWTVVPDPASPGGLGLVVDNNIIERAYNGIHLNGIYGGFKSSVATNTISLEDDNIFNLPQFGIAVENITGHNSINGNDIRGANTNSTFPASLVYANINSGVGSPKVICNTVDDSHKGFEFKSTNSSAIWAGNLMSDLAKGMVLSNGGVIGTQGSNVSAINNQWLGTAWGGTNYGTYIGASSSATGSPLWINPIGSSNPPNPSGFVAFFDQYGAPGTLNNATGGDYNCIGVPNNIEVPIPSGPDYNKDEYFYIAQTSLYRLLWDNDSIMSSATAYSTFFSNLSGSSIDVFLQVERAIYEDDHATAVSLLGTVSPTNTIESNYIDFYTIYANYSGNRAINSSDSTDLFNLTQLCPANDGACIHQARALYDHIYSLPMRYPEGCNEDNARFAFQSASKMTWEVGLFPNPATNQITVSSNLNNENLGVEVRDLSGRLVLKKDIKVIDFIATLDLGLLNGAYLITINRDNREILAKKLLIAK